MSKRFNLREFQQQVLDRLQEKTAGDAKASTLGVQVGNTSWLMEMPDISEVMPLPTLTAVPLTQPWYRGVTNVRGNLYSIVDLGAYLQHAPTPPEAHNRVLLLNARHGFNTGLIVSRVLGLRNTAGWQQNDDGYVDAQGQHWRKLDVPHLLHQPEFLQIGT